MRGTVWAPDTETKPAPTAAGPRHPPRQPTGPVGALTNPTT